MPRKKKELKPEVPKEEVAEAAVQPLVPEKPVESVSLPAPLRTFSVERRGVSGFPSAAKQPRVVGGICEHCGVLDKNVAAHLQHKLCPHYTGVDLRCSYCPPDENLEHVLSKRELRIFEMPQGSGNLVVVCDDIRCTDKHLRRFNLGR